MGLGKAILGLTVGLVAGVVALEVTKNKGAIKKVCDDITNDAKVKKVSKAFKTAFDTFKTTLTEEDSDEESNCCGDCTKCDHCDECDDDDYYYYHDDLEDDLGDDEDDIEDEIDEASELGNNPPCNECECAACIKSRNNVNKQFDTFIEQYISRDDNIDMALRPSENSVRSEEENEGEV